MEAIEISQLSQLGVGGFITIMVLKIVFDFIRTNKKNGVNNSNLNSNLINDNNLIETINRLSACIEKQSEILRESTTQNKLNTETLKRLAEDLRDLRVQGG